MSTTCRRLGYRGGHHRLAPNSYAGPFGLGVLLVVCTDSACRFAFQVDAPRAGEHALEVTVRAAIHRERAAATGYWVGGKKSNKIFGDRNNCTGNADIDNHGALTICLHAGGNPASVKTGLGLRGGGRSVDSLNQKSSSLPQPSLGSGGAGGLHSALSAGQAIWT
jgi:hypothetical protein